MKYQLKYALVQYADGTQNQSIPKNGTAPSGYYFQIDEPHILPLMLSDPRYITEQLKLINEIKGLDLSQHQQTEKLYQTNFVTFAGTAIEISELYQYRYVYYLVKID